MALPIYTGQPSAPTTGNGGKGGLPTYTPSAATPPPATAPNTDSAAGPHTAGFGTFSGNAISKFTNKSPDVENSGVNPLGAQISAPVTIPASPNATPEETAKINTLNQNAKDAYSEALKENSADSIFNEGAKNAYKGVTSAEQGFGASIAAALPKFVGGSAANIQAKLDKINADSQKSIDDLESAIKKNQAEGKDTTKLRTQLTRAMNNKFVSIDDIVPATATTPGELAGQALGTALDVITLGEFESGAKSFGMFKDAIPVQTEVKNGIQIVKNAVGRVAGGAATGYGYDVSQNLQAGKTGAPAAKPGIGTILGTLLPALPAAEKVYDETKALQKELGPGAGSRGFIKNPFSDWSKEAQTAAEEIKATPAITKEAFLDHIDNPPDHEAIEPFKQELQSKGVTPEEFYDMATSKTPEIRPDQVSRLADLKALAEEYPNYHDFSVAVSSGEDAVAKNNTEGKYTQSVTQSPQSQRTLAEDLHAAGYQGLSDFHSYNASETKVGNKNSLALNDSRFDGSQPLSEKDYKIFNKEYQNIQSSLHIDQNLLEDLPKDISGKEAFLKINEVAPMGEQQDYLEKIASELEKNGYKGAKNVPNFKSYSPEEIIKSSLEHKEDESIAHSRKLLQNQEKSALDESIAQKEATRKEINGHLDALGKIAKERDLTIHEWDYKQALKDQKENLYTAAEKEHLANKAADKKSQNAVYGGPRKINIAGKDVRIPPELEQKGVELQIRRELHDNSPLAGLNKYVSRRGENAGSLPEAGSGKSKFARSGDAIVQEVIGSEGRTATNMIDENDTREQFWKYQQEGKRLKQEEANFKETVKAHIATEKDRLAAQKFAEEEQAKIEKGDRQEQEKKTAEQTIADRAERVKARDAAEIQNKKNQETKNKVKLNISGEDYDQRVQSAIVNSERIRNEISIKGKDAFIAGDKLSEHDKKLAEAFEGSPSPVDLTHVPGPSVSELAKKADNPALFTKFMDKMNDYYDFRLAADRAAGGTTPKIQTYTPHLWDLSAPEDLDRFNKIAKQKGIAEWDGFYPRNQPRVFDSYAEGESYGFKRKNPDIVQDLKDDYQRASINISRQALKYGLKEAAPDAVSLVGQGRTSEGKPYVNSNIPGLEGMSYHPTIDKLLGGYEKLNNTDVFSLMKENGFDYRNKATYPKALESLKEAGVLNAVSTVWDRSSTAFKQLLLNFANFVPFHSINVSNNFAGASLLVDPLGGGKGLANSIPAFFSEKFTQHLIDGFKEKMVDGKDYSVFDAGLRSGVNMDRGLPATGLGKINPLSISSKAIFDRELYSLKLNLVDQTFGNGKVDPESVKGIALGREINMLMGEMNNRTMNINPNTSKWLSRILLAPEFTESKYKIIADAGTKWGKDTSGALARKAVLGKSIVVGTVATLGTVLATGKFPNLKQLLLNYTVKPTTQTNIKNPKGQKVDITYPQTFVSEPAGLIQDPVHYGEARLSPLLSTGIKVASGKDYYGNPIVDPNSKASNASQYAKNLGQGLLPIGVQSILNNREGKKSNAQTAVELTGLGTRVSPADPTQARYGRLDNAKASILKIHGDDPQRLSKMQAIFNALPSKAERKSLNYQLLLSGVRTKGIHIR